MTSYDVSKFLIYHVCFCMSAFANVSLLSICTSYLTRYNRVFCNKCKDGMNENEYLYSVRDYLTSFHYIFVRNILLHVSIYLSSTFSLCFSLLLSTYSVCLIMSYSIFTYSIFTSDTPTQKRDKTVKVLHISTKLVKYKKLYI